MELAETGATDAVALHPDDRVLASAVRKLGDGVLPGLRIIQNDPWRWLDDLRLAVRERRRVAVRYARAWEPTIEDGVIRNARLALGGVALVNFKK